MDIINYSDCIRKMIKLENDALGKIKKILDENKTRNVTIDLWHGNPTPINDRSIYRGISYKLNDREYLINGFLSEIDYNSGNCHSQLGRIQFVHKLNNKKPCSTNNIISKKKIKRLINSCINKKNELSSILEFESCGKSILVEFCFSKWNDPLDFMLPLKSSKDEVFTKYKCINKKWITIDDINNHEELPKLIANAFINYIEINENEYIEH